MELGIRTPWPLHCQSGCGGFAEVHGRQFVQLRWYMERRRTPPNQPERGALATNVTLLAYSRPCGHGRERVRMIALRSVFPRSPGRGVMLMSMQPSPWPEPAPEVAAAVRAVYRRRQPPLPVTIRDRLGELFGDGEFAAAFGTRGRPGWSPGRLALVTVLQMAENLTDRQAADAVREKISWKYALGLGLEDEGFDASVLAEFRARVVAHGLEQRALELLLEALTAEGLVKSGGRARTDSTHVISAVRDLNRLELAGESVRAAAEALAAAAPQWLAGVVDVADWAHRYGARIDSWRLPTSKTKRAELAVAYGRDAVALLRAIGAPRAPGWLRELPAVEVLRRVLVQNYLITTDARGREVIRMREAEVDGLPPGRARISSPYDSDARWAAKGEDLFWNGYKVHLTETCDEPTGDEPTGDDAAGGDAAGGDAAGDAPGAERPNLITNVATTDATVPDAMMTEPIHTALDQRGLLPGEHLLDSGYPSAELIVDSARRWGIALVSPLLADTSAQARAGEGYDRAAFGIDFDTRQATCPQGQTSARWHEVTQRGTAAVVIQFAADTCRPCPVRQRCTRSSLARHGRQLTVPPREVHAAQTAARTEQATDDWQARYAARAGVEGTIGQAVAVTGLRRARYRGLPKTRLQHVFSAVALNFIRLDAYWNGHPLDRTRTTHLSRLEVALAA
jgi:transposase